MVAILLPDKIDLNIKAIRTDKEGSDNSTSVYLFEETQNTKSKRHIMYKSIAELFIIAEIWKLTKHPSKDEWIKMWCIYTMKYDSAIKK